MLICLSEIITHNQIVSEHKSDRQAPRQTYKTFKNLCYENLEKARVFI